MIIMNKKGGVWDQIQNALIILAIILIVIWTLKSMLVDGVEKISDCENNGGYCSEICGPGSYPTSYKCDVKTKECCYDDLAVRGDAPPSLTITEAEIKSSTSCTDLSGELNKAYKIIWMNMASANPKNSSTCRVVGDNYYSRNPCDTKQTYYTACKYTERDAHCLLVGLIDAQKATIADCK